MPNSAGRIAVQGKILTFKQSRQFEKFMQDETFRQRYMELSSQKTK